MALKLKAEMLVGRAEKGPYYIPSVLATFSDRIKDWRQFWATVFIPRYLEQVQQNFQTEGELTGNGWPELNPRYAAWKSRHFPGTRILERTRRLRESLAPGTMSSDTLVEAGPTHLRLGTRVPYARYHVWTRPFLPRIVLRDWLPIARQWIRQQAEAAGAMRRA